jgi:hypothetical protein
LSRTSAGRCLFDSVESDVAHTLTPHRDDGSTYDLYDSAGGKREFNNTDEVLGAGFEYTPERTRDGAIDAAFPIWTVRRATLIW